MKTKRCISTLLAILLSVLSLTAQDVTVTVTPIQPVLPPQAALYINNPGRNFHVSVINNTQETQNVYLALQLEQTNPVSGLSVSTPPKRQPQHPIVIPSGTVRQISPIELKTMFNHIPESEIATTPGLFDDYRSGAFGLLPEGQYQCHLTAYKWDPTLATPVVLSNPNDGKCQFMVCYKAQAPKFLTPFTTLGDDLSVARLNPLNAQFTWEQPVVACSGSQQFKYKFKVVELMPGQQPDDAIDKNPSVYQIEGLMTPTCIIPVNTIKTRMDSTRTYIARVEAIQRNITSNMLNYVMLENEGRSNLKFFNVKEGNKPDMAYQPKDSVNKDSALISGVVSKDKHITDSLYAFRNPTLLSPSFYDESSRKVFVDNDIQVNWRKAWYLGGEGNRADTVRFNYEVQLFKMTKEQNRQEAFKSNPFYTIKTKELLHTISWEAIKDSVAAGDILVLRVVPTSPNTPSIEFVDDSVNVKDFALDTRLTKRIDICNNDVAINNFTLTSSSASDLKGKTVSIGQFRMLLDKVEKVKNKDFFKGEGHVEWKPGGVKTMVCVKFDSLKINTDNVVIGGKAVTYQKPEDKVTDTKAVEELFSDTGLDNLVGNKVMGYAKNIGEKINIANYYEYYAKGKAVYKAFMKQEISDLYMPLMMPKNLNHGPFDVQIVSMTFTPGYATMNLLGMFKLPESKALDNNILIMGSPRICMEPDKLLPQTGFLSLLADVNVKDPKSDYEMRFKAPEDVLSPTNGCYMAWGNDSIGGLSLDLDMQIPNLKREENGKVIDEMPTLNIRSFIHDWEDWTAQATMDSFQSEDMPGFSFRPGTILYDHSAKRNATGMGKFPIDYERNKAGINTDNEWQGLYMGNLNVMFPEAIQISKNSEKRLQLGLNSLFLDRSGISFNLAVEDPLNLGKGEKGATVGGWALTIDNIALNVTQNTFSKFFFDGQIDVPLLDGTIGYQCNIYNQKSVDKNRSGYAYVFAVQQVENLNMDFFLAEASLDKKQSYLLIEAEDQPSGKTETRIELCAGGSINIGGKEFLDKKIKSLGNKLNLPLNISLPGIHFVNLRVVNCQRWESKYAKDLQDAAKAARSKKGNSIINIKLAENKEYKFDGGDSKLYFECGEWSLASAEKKIGPFTFALEEFSPTMQGKQLGLEIKGRINLCDTIIAASTTIAILANVDVDKMALSYEKTEFREATLDCNFGGMVTIKGDLTVSSAPDKGYAGKLTVGIKGLFSIESEGGYFEHTSTGADDRNYTWGYFTLKLEGERGIPVGGGVFINKIQGGFYFNCYREGGKLDATPTAQHGIIGIDLGMGLFAGAAEAKALEGDFMLTVAYDKDKNRLTTFLFTGNAKALSGIVDANNTLHYQNDDTNHFLRINVTADMKADANSIAKAGGLDKFSGQLDDASEKLRAIQEKLHGGPVKTVTEAKGGLEDAIGDKSGETGGKKNSREADKAKEAATGKKTEPSVSAGAKIAIEFAVVFKENGKEKNPAHWHFYLGEPAKDKRCNFQLIDFKTKIVSVNIGADAYFCMSNDKLPGDGNLPPIPGIISSFLNGAPRGAGVVSDSKDKAIAGRKRAMEKFKAAADAGGGVMLGASVWGYINVDLGILYADMGAIAGFDVCLQHLKDAYCTNINGPMGYQGWYATGQLYAYLYAKMGLHIDLGFWEKKFDIIDAGLGGVLKCGLPNPSWAEGTVRCKLRMFGGLVNINKKYSFECGKVCKVFYGNALDNFELFGGCSIAFDNKGEGWDRKAQISPRLKERVSIETQALLNSDIRVVDPTDAAELQDEGKDSITIASEASRTFVFRFKQNVINAKLYEYDNADERGGISRNVQVYNANNSSYKFELDMGTLKANKFYKLVFIGEAKEKRNGAVIDPERFDKKKGKYVPTPWSNTKEYFFCTGELPPLGEVPDIKDATKLVFPSKDGKTIPTTQVDAYLDDVKEPTIALDDTRIKNESFGQGTLVWQLLNERGAEVSSQLNTYVTNGDAVNMKPVSPFDNVKIGKNYIIRMIYVKSHTERQRIVETERDTVADFREDTYTQQELAEQVQDIIKHARVKINDSDKKTIRNAIMTKKAAYSLNQGKAVRIKGNSPQLGANHNSPKTDADARAANMKNIIDRGNIKGTSGTGGIRGDLGGRGGTITKPGSARVLPGNGMTGVMGSPTLSHPYESTSTTTKGAIFSTSTPSVGSDTQIKSNLNNAATTKNMNVGVGVGVGGYSNAKIPSSSKMRFFIQPLVDEEGGSMIPQSNNKPNVKVTYKDVVVYDTAQVFTIKVHTIPGSWETGKLEYSKPYVSYKLNNISWEHPQMTKYSDADISSNAFYYDGVPVYLNDPYVYFAYLGNAAFLGGLRINCKRLNNLYVTTSQSLIYTTPMGKWGGMYNRSSSTTIYDSYLTLRNMSSYSSSNRGTHPQYANWPLHRWGEENVQGEDAYELVYVPNKDDRKKVGHALHLLAAPYALAYDISNQIDTYTSTIKSETLKGDFTKRANKVESWLKPMDGVYIRAVSWASPYTLYSTYNEAKGEWSTQLGSSAVEIPGYQFAIAWGGTEDNRDSNKKVTLFTTTPLQKSDWRPHRKISTTIWNSFNTYKFTWNRACESAKQMKQAVFTIYRVNTWHPNKQYYSPEKSVSKTAYRTIYIDNPLGDILK